MRNQEKVFVESTDPVCIQKDSGGGWTEVTWREPLVRDDMSLIEWVNLRVTSYGSTQTAMLNADVNGGVYQP